ncbi:SdpI family protein [Paenibacillus sp. Marseille-Q4541]|uniref:SdpI family protein n=1 Tax=Paenibacillus sp. Marseille-Q4541 TaxID=2831522 RepID=UPI001BA4F755|nr:SdpI family protein [Paenibacillus sp. Marseille-Q4541]
MDLDNLVVFSFVGIVFVIIGVAMKWKPPKKINSFYGYRTNRSMSSQRMWEEANRYSAMWMIYVGIFFIFIGFIVAKFVQDIQGLGILVGVFLTVHLLLYVMVERRLKELE